MSKPAAIFGFKTHNLGDDVQAYAALLHLSRVAAFIDRDRMDAVNLGEPHVTLLNSWFKFNHPQGSPGSFWNAVSKRFGNLQYGVPSPSIAAVPYGFYLGKPKILEHGWADYLRQLGSIGCRNQYTIDRLAEAGVEGHLTGCLTMFLGELFPRPEKRSGVVFIDIDPAIERTFIPSDLSRRAVRVSNFVPPSILNDPWSRFAAVARLIERLRTAELVVTRRLHGALPCIGLGTPVVALPDPEVTEARHRAQGFSGIIPMVFKDETDKAGSIDWDSRAAAVVPAAMRERYQALCDRLSSEVGPIRRIHSPAISQEWLRIQNPGLGPRAVNLGLSLVGGKRKCRILDWTSDAILLDLPHFAGVENLDADVEVQEKGGAYAPVAKLSRLLIAPE